MITVKDEFQYIEEIKRSIFTTWVTSVATIDEAMDFIKIKSLPNATHNCWAYKIAGEYRFTDDGEPSSTAGKPIYSAIDYSGLDNVVVLVTRESSGIKLGTGGLIRAYGGSTTKALNLSEKVEIKETISISFTVAMQYIGKAYHIADQHQCIKESENFGDQNILFSFLTEIEKAEAFQRDLINATNGEVTFHD